MDGRCCLLLKYLADFLCPPLNDLNILKAYNVHLKLSIVITQDTLIICCLLLAHADATYAFLPLGLPSNAATALIPLCHQKLSNVRSRVQVSNEKEKVA